MSLIWRKIKIPLSELDLSSVLKNGQCFTWNQTDNKEWTSVLKHKLVSLKQLDDGIEFALHSINTLEAIDDMEKTLVDYFQLNTINLTSQYKSWSLIDKNFAIKGIIYPGIRILRQDPVENVFSFICSSNNNINRITKMVNNLCRVYGEYIGKYKETLYYSFPEIEALTKEGVEVNLRNLGFGYRAKYIVKSAKSLEIFGGREWLLNLREVPYLKAKLEIMKLDGIGPKVADCICLMSLDKHEAVPVDTHVYQIAVRDYKLKKQASKTLSKKSYEEVSSHFFNMFGPYAGWAHTVLFTADLKTFQVKK